MPNCVFTFTDPLTGKRQEEISVHELKAYLFKGGLEALLGEEKAAALLGGKSSQAKGEVSHLVNIISDDIEATEHELAKTEREIDANSNRKRTRYYKENVALAEKLRGKLKRYNLLLNKAQRDGDLSNEDLSFLPISTISGHLDSYSFDLSSEAYKDWQNVFSLESRESEDTQKAKIAYIEKYRNNPVIEATHTENGKAEPVTQDVVTQSLKTADDSSPKISFKESKDELLRQIDAAIENAQPEAELLKDTKFKSISGAISSLGSEPSVDARDWVIDDYNQRREALLQYLNIEKVVFDIKGDGKFTVTNTKEALQAFKAKVEKAKLQPQANYPTQKTITKQTDARNAIDSYIKEAESLKKKINNGQTFLQQDYDDTLQLIVDISENNDITDNKTVNRIKQELGVEPTEIATQATQEEPIKNPELDKAAQAVNKPYDGTEEDWVNYIKSVPFKNVSFWEFKQAVTAKTNNEKGLITWFFDGKQIVDPYFMSEDTNQTALRDVYNNAVKESEQGKELFRRADEIERQAQEETKQQSTDEVGAGEDVGDTVESKKQNSFDLDPEDVEESFDEDLLALFQPEPETPSKFKQWFKQSWFTRDNVNDRNAPAEPAKFYHATNADELTYFDKSKLGSNTKTQATSGLGFFFSKNKADTARFGKTVLEVHLSAQKPLVTYSYKLPAFEDIEQAKRFSKALQDRGYDGIYLKDAGYAIIFNSNQAKLTSNTEPTDSDDIRYSKRAGDDKTLDVFSDFSANEWNELDRAYFDAIERGDMEAAQRMVIEAARGKNVETFTVDEATNTTGKIRRGKTPKKTVKAYRKVRFENGKAYANFVGSGTPIPMGVWLDATEGKPFYGITTNAKGEPTGFGKYVPTGERNSETGKATKGTGSQIRVDEQAISILLEKGKITLEQAEQVRTGREMLVDSGYMTEKGKGVKAVAYRAGFHASELPYFPQGGKKDALFDKQNPTDEHPYGMLIDANEAIVEVELDMDIDYKQDPEYQPYPVGLPKLPVNGGYEFKTNNALESDGYGWFISGSVKHLRILSPQETNEIMRKHKDSNGNAMKGQKWFGGEPDWESMGVKAGTLENQKKLLDTVTYDDNGNIIPLSQRFNAQSTDPRYSKTKSTQKTHTKQSFLNQFTKQLDAKFGQGWSNLLMATGKVRVVSSDEARKQYGKNAGEAQGFYSKKEDVTYFVFDNIDKNKDLLGLASHEIASHQLMLGKDDKEFQDILAELARMRKSSKPVQDAYTRALDSFGLSVLPIADSVTESINRHAYSSSDILAAKSTIKKLFNQAKIISGSSVSGGMKSSANQSVFDSSSTAIQFLSNVLEGHSSISKAFNSADINKSMMLDAMSRIAQDGKILDSVIEFIPVDVMDMLISRKFTPDMLRHNMSMGIDLNTINRNNPIPSTINSADSIFMAIVHGARLRTKYNAIHSLESGFPNVGNFSTPSASNINTRFNTTDRVGTHNFIPNNDIELDNALSEIGALLPSIVSLDDVNNEVISYLLEYHPQLSIVQRFLAWFKKKLRAIGKALPMAQRLDWFKRVAQLNETDLVYMAHSALRNAPSDLLFDSSSRKNESIFLARKQGYEGASVSEAEEWIRAVEKGLDMSFEARMERARDMGFDTSKKWYHGTKNRPIKAFNKYATRDDENRRTGGEGTVSFSSSPEFASKYAGENGSVYPVFLGGNIFDFRNKNELRDALDKIDDWYDQNPDYDTSKFRDDNIAMIKSEIAKGQWGVLEHDLNQTGFFDDNAFDGFLTEEQGIINQIMLNTDMIRSVNAAFDPDYADSPNLLASYAGQKAKNADKSALARAVEMEQQGVDMETIRKDTGWFLGFDERWRFEIDDSNASVSIPERDISKLSDVLTHDALYEAYPELKDVIVELNTNIEGNGAYRNAGKYNDSPIIQINQKTKGFAIKDLEKSIEFYQNSIEQIASQYDEETASLLRKRAEKKLKELTQELQALRENEKIVDSDFKSILLHEIQHAIQEFEGFARGGNSKDIRGLLEESLKDFQGYSENINYKLMDIANLTKAATNLEIIDKLKRNPASIEKMGSLWFQYKPMSLPTNKADRTKAIEDIAKKAIHELRYDNDVNDALDYIDDLNATPKELRKAAKELAATITEQDKKGASIAEKVQSALNKYNDFELYQRLAGEIEARDTQARMGMTAEERRNSTPYVSQGIPKEDAIVRFGDGVAMSAEQSEEQRQYKEVEARYFNEDGTPKKDAMLAPNGEPTNLNKHQWIQVRTPNFIKWFGDWQNDPENASQVVDNNGEPLVVYHGTTSDFSEFKTEELGKTTGSASAYKGFFFASNPLTTEGYLKKVINRDLARKKIKQLLDEISDEKKEMDRLERSFPPFTGKYDKNGNPTRKKLKYKHEQDAFALAYEKYKVISEKIAPINGEIVKLKRILDSSDFKILTGDIPREYIAFGSGNVMPVFLNVKNPLLHNFYGDKFRDATYNDLLSDAIDNKNDGAIFLNTFDGGFDPKNPPNTNIYIAFESNQIKSATANTGAFSQDNNDIRYSIASPVTDFFTGEPTQASTIDDIDTMLSTGRQPRRDTGLQYWKDKIVTAFADSTRPFERFVRDYLPDHASEILSGADRATGMKSAFEHKAMGLYGRDIGKAIRAIQKANPKFDYKTAKDLAGTWLSVRYAPIANDWLMEQDQKAVNDLIASGASKAKIDKAKAEQAKRIAAINDTSIKSPITQPKDSGLAGGYNNATAEYLKDRIESEIDIDLLETLADHVYDLNEWTLRQDIRNGKISPALASSFPASRYYVPLSGDPRTDKNMDLTQNGIDASFEELQKSASYHGFKDFKDAIENAYDDLIQSKLDDGKSQEEAESEVWEENRIKRTPKGTKPVGDDDIVANGMIYTIGNHEAMQALHSLDNEDVPSILKPIAYLTRLQARLVTLFMPLFAPTNMIRDVAERSENIRTRKIEGFNGDMNQVANDSIKNAARLLMKIKPVMMGVLAENTPLEKLFKVDDANPDVQDLKRFLALGGSSTYGDILSNDSKKLADKLKQTGTIPDNVMEAIHLYNNAFELISGFSIYQSLVKQGLDERKAATASLNLMNFRKRGKYMNPIRALYMFAQPIATGGHQLAKTLTTKKGLARFAAYTVAAALLYSLLRSGDDDDEIGINKMDEQGNFTLYRNILISTGDGKYLKIPVGFGMQQLAWSHGVNFVRMAAGSMTPSEAAAESIALWTKAAAPIAPAETAILKHPAVWVAQTFTPQIAKPIVNVSLDVNAFGAPLTNARYAKEDKAQALQGRRDTPEFYKMAVEELAKATDGQVDMYPEQLRELLRGYGAGVGNEMLKWLIENPAKEGRGLKTVSPAIDRYVLQSNDDSLKQRLYFRLRDRMNELNALESTGGTLTPEEKRLADLGDVLKKREAQQRAKLAAATKAERNGNMRKAETLRALADRMRVSYIDYGLMQGR